MVKPHFVPADTRHGLSYTDFLLQVARIQKEFSWVEGNKMGHCNVWPKVIAPLAQEVAVEDLTIEARSEFYHLPSFHDPVSSMSHLFGAVLFSALGYLLLRRGRGDRTRLIFLGIYVVT